LTGDFGITVVTINREPVNNVVFPSFRLTVDPDGQKLIGYYLEEFEDTKG